uniref:Uncharacterized protein n=1 Tax=Arundo donax TaxID=35708 RepID=A0A0A9CJX8_ARUDO
MSQLKDKPRQCILQSIVYRLLVIEYILLALVKYFLFVRHCNYC